MGGDGVGGIIRGALAEALALLLPTACAGCDEPDVSLCDSCRADLRPRVHSSRPAVWSGLPFDAVPARVVRALKEEGRTGLAGALAPALRAAVTEAVAAASAGHDSGDVPKVVIVPMPTSRAAFRRRGYRVVELVARRARLPCARLLQPARITADQRGLGRADRRRNVSGSLRAHGASGMRVLVIDDVVTTGATLDEAFRALRAGGAEVLGAATIAATPLRGGRAGPYQTLT